MGEKKTTCLCDVDENVMIITLDRLIRHHRKAMFDQIMAGHSTIASPQPVAHPDAERVVQEAGCPKWCHNAVKAVSRALWEAEDVGGSKVFIELEAERDRLLAERDRYREAFIRTLEFAEDAMTYVPPYFVTKYGYDDDLANLKALKGGG